MIKKVALFEIFLLISATIAFSWMVHESDSSAVGYGSESNSVKKARELFIEFFGSNLVSAQESLWTCPINLNGTRCQEYAAQACNSQCNSTCFPGPRDSFSASKFNWPVSTALVIGEKAPK